MDKPLGMGKIMQDHARSFFWRVAQRDTYTRLRRDVQKAKSKELLDELKPQILEAVKADPTHTGRDIHKKPKKLIR